MTALATITSPAPANHKCAGSWNACCMNGRAWVGVYVENGVPKGHDVGVCFRCGGKGFQTPADEKRNAYYDNHVRRIPM